MIGATVQNTPELVAAGNTAGLPFLDEADADQARSRSGCAAQGVKVQIVVIHEGAAAGHQRDRRRRRRCRGTGRSSAIVDAAAGHHDRPRDRRAHAPGRQHGRRAHPGRRGLQRGRQLLGRAADGQGRRRRLGRRGDAHGQEPRRRAAARREGDRRQGQRRDGRAAQPRDRHAERRHPARPERGSTSRRWATSSPTRCAPSTRGSMRRSPTRAACARTSCSPPPSAGEQPGEITWGEVFAVLPFGNPTVIETLTGAQLAAALRERLQAAVRRRGRRHRPHAAVLRA